MWAALVDMIVLVVPLENPPAVSALLFALAIALTSAAIVVAVTKHRLYAVDRLLSATFLYGVLAVLVVGVDLAVFAVAGGVLGERDCRAGRDRGRRRGLRATAEPALASGYDGSSAAPAMIRTRPCPRWPSGWSRRPTRTSSCVRSPARWRRRSGCRTCGWRSSGPAEAGDRRARPGGGPDSCAAGRLSR